MGTLQLCPALVQIRLGSDFSPPSLIVLSILTTQILCFTLDVHDAGTASSTTTTTATTSAAATTGFCTVPTGKV